MITETKKKNTTIESKNIKKMLGFLRYGVIKRIFD
jgi:hypothetical protein